MVKKYINKKNFKFGDKVVYLGEDCYKGWKGILIISENGNPSIDRIDPPGVLILQDFEDLCLIG